MNSIAAQIELAEDLGKSIQADGTHPHKDPEAPVQRWQPSSCKTEEQAKKKDPAIDGNIPLAQSNLVSHRIIACESPGFDARRACRVAQSLDAGGLLEREGFAQVRLCQWVKRLLTEQEKGTETELMTERTVYCIEDTRRSCPPSFHQCWGEEWEAYI